LMVERWDVLVVGAGFAGLMAGWELARLGKSVLVIDKKRDIGTTGTTGGIARRWLDILGLELPRRTIASDVVGVEIHAPDRTCFRAEFPNVVGYITHPDRVLEWLAEEARKAGAEVLLGAEFTEFGDSGSVVARKSAGEEVTYHAKHVVGADGVMSRVGRLAGLCPPLPRSDVHIGYERRVLLPDYDDRVMRAYLGPYAPLGYGWAVPAGGGVVKVGIGVSLSVGRVRWYYSSFLRDYPDFVGYTLSEGGGLISTARYIEKPVTKKGDVWISLIGDAARLCDPASGGGIHFAWISARALAKAIVEGKPSRYVKYTGPIRRILKGRYVLKQVMYGWSDDDKNRVIRTLQSFRPKSVDPLREVRRLVWHLLRNDPSLLGRFLPMVRSLVLERRVPVVVGGGLGRAR